jgi:hypothetical protein
MKVTVEQTIDWSAALQAARLTTAQNKRNPAWDDFLYAPSNRWILKMLFAEHSPIRRVRYWIEIHDVKRWVVGHLIRHKGGVEPYDTEPFVATQRSDRTGIDRDQLPQGESSVVGFDLNAQALMAMSRSRLCRKASLETRVAWGNVRDAMLEVDAEMAMMMVPKCVHQGVCPEMAPCGYSELAEGIAERRVYLEMLEEIRRPA